MNQITVFLNLGMQGLGTKTFTNVDVEDTLNSFLLRVADQEGAVGVDWIRTGTKVLTGTKFGHLKLKEFGFYHEITLWASLRLKGGAEQSKMQFVLNADKIKTLFASLSLKGGAEELKIRSKKIKTLWTSLRSKDSAEECKIQNVTNAEKVNDINAEKIKAFGGSTVIESCIICMDQKLNGKLACNCVYCSDCMGDLIDRQTNQECASEISCFNCKKHVDSILAFEIAAYSDKQKGIADKALFRNSLKKPDSMMSECSNLECKQIIAKQATNGNRLKCGVCKKQTCQLCKLSWINNDVNDKIFCGNTVCDPSIMYQTFLDHAQDKDIGGVIVTNTRFCTKCLTVNIHEEACKHITCPCKHQYCHICLQDWIGHKSDLCKVADKQTITKEMILRLSKQ